eukprot:g6048.t1
MNSKALAIFLVVLQCATLLTQAARPLGEEASYGSKRKVLAFASGSSSSSARSNHKYGSASAYLNLKAVNGRIDGIVSADSKAVSEAKTSIATATSDAIARVKAGGKAVAHAKAAAEAVGFAIAKARADTVVAIVSEGDKNSGCGTAKAIARAEAKTFALAIAKAFADARNFKAEAIVKGHVVAIQTAYVKALAKAESNGCVKGTGYTVATQESLAIAFAKVYVAAYAEALAAVKDSFSGSAVNIGALTDADEVATVESKSTAQARGIADAFNSGLTFADVYLGP